MLQLSRVLTVLFLIGGVIRGVAGQSFTDSLVQMPTHDRLLALNAFLMEKSEKTADKAEVIRRLSLLTGSLQDSQLRKYLDFYRFILPALAWEDPDMCIRLLTDASDHYKAKGKKLFSGICLHMIGQHHYMREDFAPAFDHLLRANDLFREIGYANIPEIGRYLHELALAHYYFRDYHKVVNLMHASVSLPPYNKNLNMQRYNNLALAYRNSGRPDSALYYFEHTLRLAEQYRDSIWISIIYGNIGSVYHKMGLYDKALDYLTRLKKEKEGAQHLAREKTLQLEKLTIRKELSEARRKLRDYLDLIGEKERLVEKLTKDLETLRQKGGSPVADDREINRMEEDLRDIRILTNQHWEDFQQRFEELYNDFSQHLRGIQPRLTQAETRFFMLSALGLSEQEMAHSLGVLPATIRMIRHRIKKKYGMPAEELVPVLREYPAP